MAPPQQIKNDKDLQRHKHQQDGRWTQAITNAKCILLYTSVISGIVVIMSALIFAGQVGIDYYNMVKADEAKMKDLCSFLVSHSASFALGLLPAVIYTKLKEL